MSADVLERSKAIAMRAPGWQDTELLDAAVRRLLMYYDADGLYAASTFIDAPPVDPWAITAADLSPSAEIFERTSERLRSSSLGRGRCT